MVDHHEDSDGSESSRPTRKLPATKEITQTRKQAEIDFKARENNVSKQDSDRQSMSIEQPAIGGRWRLMMKRDAAANPGAITWVSKRSGRG